MTVCLFSHKKVVWQIWIFTQYSLKMMTFLARSLHYCTICNLCGWRFRALCRMHRTCLSMLTWDHLRLWPTDANARSVFCGVQIEDSWPNHFLCMSEPSSRHCLTHWWIAFGDGASCWFSSHQNLRWVSVMDPAWINSSTARAHVHTPYTHTHTHTTHT
jgi:hypothetical protein